MEAHSNDVTFMLARHGSNLCSIASVQNSNLTVGRANCEKTNVVVVVVVVVVVFLVRGARRGRG
jgi:hypothetical protein